MSYDKELQDALEHNTFYDKKFEEQVDEIDEVFGKYDSFEEYENDNYCKEDLLARDIIKYISFNKDNTFNRIELTLSDKNIYNAFNNYKENKNSENFNDLYATLETYFYLNSIDIRVKPFVLEVYGDYSDFLKDLIINMTSDINFINDELDFQKLVIVKNGEK